MILRRKIYINDIYSVIQNPRPPLRAFLFIASAVAIQRLAAERIVSQIVGQL